MPASEDANVNYARGGSAPLCGATTASNAVCCATAVLGAASLDCVTPSTVPKDIPDFKKICASSGQQAQCCLLVVAGQGVLCSNPV
ncbi:hypothetical protein M413DRAFT_70208 [Hebeloma cylindrosporum]|uniref:Hydrophobin n=1 Tax=Hebeloma cylindrosporum TaxID=76867 RepID=A0A0C3CE82_HEBCY|nr:hypothetical protein M413DRAFT_70208 [Hebeloma cylindrosporum h7]